MTTPATHKPAPRRGKPAALKVEAPSTAAVAAEVIASGTHDPVEACGIPWSALDAELSPIGYDWAAEWATRPADALGP